MAVSIPVNATNAVQNSDGTYSSFTYRFPQSSNFTDKQIQLNSIICPYSWFNITARYQNNTFHIVWIDGTNLTVTLPDGFYSVSDINLFLQQQMIAQTWYTINNAGAASETFNYYLALAENSTYYAVQLHSLNVPTSSEAAAAGITQPAGASWSFPLTDTNPQFIIPTFTQNIYSQSFSQLLGFTPQTWPTAQTPGSNQSILSNFTPNLNPVATVNILCSMVNNPYSNNYGVLTSFSMADTAFGSNYSALIPQETWYAARPNFIDSFTITLVDQSLNNRILMRDVFSFNIQLSIRDSPVESRAKQNQITSR